MKLKIYQLLLLFLFIAIGVLFIVEVPVSVSSRGVIRSQSENTPIVSAVSGRVVFNKLEKNNQAIQKGDTLLIVTTEQLDTQKSLTHSQSADFQAQLSDLSKLVNGNYSGLQTGLYQREVSAMQERIAQVQSQLALATKDLERATTLYHQGVIAKAEYDKYFHDHQGLSRQVASIREQQVAQWQTQKRETERQLRALGSEIQKINQEQKNYVVTAHSSGHLVGFTGIKEGSFVAQGQAVGEISPKENLLAECLVLPKDIGFVKLGQEVKFQIDTYNYNQWGLLDGKVSEIDQNITSNQQTGEAYFRVLCKMNSDFLQLKNGYKGQIGKGMTLTARFHLTDRTLWQLLFDKIDDWMNPNLMSNEQ
ncbi:HlyD family secretion protein [Capnocytophaga sp. ARDL2]|uniref:HlyD family secretion protein n=1 Tax=Capnocytophaga sp. ARDL2 TaxID=3238809 RepID=UPI0035566224